MQERAEKEAAQARIVELESQLAMRPTRREQDPITMLAYEALSLVRAGADVEVSLNTAGLTQENRVAVEERLQTPINEGVHSFSVTAARGSEESTEQQSDSVAQNRVITIRQSARAQHNNRDIQPAQEVKERERGIALNLLSINMPIGLISSTPGLSIEEVEDLQRAETIEQTTSEMDDMTIIDSIVEEGAINRLEREDTSLDHDGVTIVPSITEEDLASIERRLSMNE
jgi:Fe2+ transport system protein B